MAGNGNGNDKTFVELYAEYWVHIFNGDRLAMMICEEKMESLAEKAMRLKNEIPLGLVQWYWVMRNAKHGSWIKELAVKNIEALLPKNTGFLVVDAAKEDFRPIIDKGKAYLTLGQLFEIYLEFESRINSRSLRAPNEDSLRVIVGSIEAIKGKEEDIGLWRSIGNGNTVLHDFSTLASIKVDEAYGISQEERLRRRELLSGAP
jgi:hypothetical protein